MTKINLFSSAIVGAMFVSTSAYSFAPDPNGPLGQYNSPIGVERPYYNESEDDGSGCVYLDPVFCNPCCPAG